MPDGEMLRVIIMHRYDVMTRYLQTLRQTYQDEIETLRQKHAGTFQLRTSELVRLLQRESDTLPADLEAQRVAALAHSERLALLERMRAELASLWARSSASSDQLLIQLRDWIERAEQSGIAQLQEFSHRLRCYAA